MILVIGAASSGKKEYVKSLGYCDGDFSSDPCDARPVLRGLEELVAMEPEACLELMERLEKKRVVICNEVGSGVIPADGRERAAREQTGRLCILLAQRAEKVVRLICGIPSVIKG